MPNRSFTVGAQFRLTFNGQEKKELNENITSAEFWTYDSRSGKRWNIDPKPNISISPYSCFSGNPIWFTDIKGDTVRGENGFDKAAYRASLVEQINLLESYKKDGLPGGLAANKGNLNAKLNEMKAALSTFDALEARKEIIVVRKGDAATNPNEAWTNFNISLNAPRVDIGTAVNDNDIYLISHELQHVEDYFNGSFSFAADGTGGILVDISDEIGPNNRQEILASGIVASSPNPTTWTNITLPNKVFNDGTRPYSVLPTDKRTLSNPSWQTFLKVETAKSVFSNTPQPHFYVGWESDRAEAVNVKKCRKKMMQLFKRFYTMIKMKKFNSVLVFYFLWLIQSQAQLVKDTYFGNNNGMKLIVKSDTIAILSYRYETTVSFEFECRIVKKTDSTFQLENLSKTTDKIEIANKRKNKDAKLEVVFFSVNKAKQISPIEINYELLSCSINNNFQCICFFYNHRLYCYTFKKAVKRLNIFIDIENSFLITNWKIRGDFIVPFINGKEVNKWVLTRKT